MSLVRISERDELSFNYCWKMVDALSRGEISRLGAVMRVGVLTNDSPMWATYEVFLNRCDQIRDILEREIRASLNSHDVVITGRTKSRDTLREKLIRTPTIQLPNIDDLIGIRIVGEFSLREQDRIAKILSSDLERKCKIKDRRKEPVSGYRALHLIPRVEELHAEIQIRTLLQSQWADLFERRADTWGRQIRYGEPPNPDLDGKVDHRIAAIQQLKELSLNYISSFEEHVVRIEEEDAKPPTQNVQSRTLSSQEIRGKSKEELRLAYRQKLVTREIDDLRKRREESGKAYRDSVADLRQSITKALNYMDETLP